MADRRLAGALVAVIVRYLTTIQPHARRELARWRRRALSIPDPELRAHVLRPFDADMSAVGASLFAVLAPWSEQPALVRLLVAYVLLWSYVDVRTERDPDTAPRLHDALVAALPGKAVEAPCWIPDDNGYLAELIVRCRAGCLALPAWPAVAPAAQRLADDGRRVQAINHGPPVTVRTRLRLWATGRPDAPWHEVCAAASSPLAIHALMALAAHENLAPRDICSTVDAYRLVSALGVLCDHLIDQAEDDTLANHSYLAYLGAPSARSRSLCDLADRAASAVKPLPSSPRHTVLLAAMTAMFCSRQQASRPALRPTADAVLDAIGAPAPQLASAMRWRVSNRPGRATTP